jgi:hypothetical protein
MIAHEVVREKSEHAGSFLNCAYKLHLKFVATAPPATENERGLLPISHSNWTTCLTSISQEEEIGCFL